MPTIEGSGSQLISAHFVYRDLFGAPIFSLGKDGQLFVTNLLFPDGTAQTTAGGGGGGTATGAQFSNDTAATAPSPLATQKAPTLQQVALSAAAATIQVASNVLTVKTYHPFSVGEKVTFNSINGATFLNGQQVTIASVNPLQSATITNISSAGSIGTLTFSGAVTSTFLTLTNNVLRLSGLTTNTFLNGVAIAPITISGSTVTFQWKNIGQIVTGVETGTATEAYSQSFTAPFSHVDYGPISNTGNVGTTTNPVMWAFDGPSAKWYDLASIQSVPLSIDPLKSPVRLEFNRSVRFNDSGINFNGVAQASPISIFHQPGSVDFLGNDWFDVTMGIATQNASGDTNTYENQHSIYLENRVRGSALYLPAAGETGITGVRSVVDDQHATIWPSALVVAGVAGVYDLNPGAAAGIQTSGASQMIGVLGETNVNTGIACGFSLFIGVKGSATDSTGGVATQDIGYGGQFSATGHKSKNVGIYVPNHAGNGNSTNWDAIFDTSGANSGYVGIAGHLVMGADSGPGHASIRTARSGGSAPANSDVCGALAFAAATAVTYTFTETYNVSNPPIVVITPVNPGATTFTITALSNTAFTVTASGSFTGTVNYIVIGRN